MNEYLFGQIKSVVWRDARKEKPKCCGELKRSKYICAKEHSILTEDGEFVYDEVGKTWFLTELVAKEKR